MKTIIYGYTDKNRLSGETVIGGDGVTSEDETNAIMDRARNQHIFPEGCLAIAQFILPDEPHEVHEFISDEARGVIQNGFKAGVEADNKLRQLSAMERDRAKYSSAAEKLFQAAANERNKAVAAVAAHRNLLSADVVQKSEKEKASIVANIEKTQPAADEAINNFETVMIARNTIKNPKSTPEDYETALIILKLKPATETK